MEQRLAEFREARKRAGLVSQPSTASQGEQTSVAKAEPAAATPKTATGWLRRFLKRKASPAIMRARPNQAQVRRETSTLKPRLRVGPRPRLLPLKALYSLCALSSPAQWLNAVFPQCVSARLRHGPVQQLIAKRKRRSGDLEERSISALELFTAR